MDCNGPRVGVVRDIFNDEALALIDELHRRFERGRQDLLQAREAKRERLAAGDRLDFPPETAEIRRSDWTVAPPPDDLADANADGVVGLLVRGLRRVRLCDPLALFD